MKYLFLHILSLVIFNCSTLPKPSPPTNPKIGDTFYAKEMATWRISSFKKDLNLQGIAVGLVEKNLPIFEKLEGKADSKNQLNENTKFYIGSVSKLFTAILILKLAEEKKIQLDKPITDYLQNLKLIPRYSTDKLPTVKQMLFHHSGIPSDQFHGFLLPENSEEIQKKEFLNLAESEIYMADSPEKVMSYSNLSYSLLGALIEKLSGMSLEEYTKKTILTPLGMNNTSFYTQKENVSSGFKGSKNKEPMRLRDLAAGSITSTLNDMLKLVSLFINEDKVLSKDSFALMQKKQNSTPYDFDYRIGLPFWFSSHPQDPILHLGHGGDVPPFHAYLGFLPKEKMGIVVMTNTESSSLKLEELGSQILGDFYEAKTLHKPYAINKKSKLVTKTKQELQKWEGKYLTSNGWMHVKAEENRLSTDQPIYFYPTETEDFAFKLRLFFGLVPLNLSLFDDLKVRFTKGKKGESIMGWKAIEKLYILYGSTEEVLPVSEIWKKRVGKYEILNKEANPTLNNFSIEYSSSDNLLYLNSEMQMVGSVPFRSSLFISTDNLGYLGTLGRNQGFAVVAKIQNGEEILEFSGYKLKKK